VQRFLAGLDEKINPVAGLNTWHANPDSSSEKVLLIVHGFISSTRHLLEEMAAIGEGRTFLQAAKKRYRKILTFDHPTISVSPLLNALDLQRVLRDERADVDVICHSRGGLVARWWLEGLGGPAYGSHRRVIFVGSPLAGTGLAAPPRLRAALELLNSIGTALQRIAEFAAVASVFAQVAAALFSVVNSLLKALAKTPFVDGAINMIAGVSSMSRVGNNPDLTRLRVAVAGTAFDPQQYDYYAVKSNFEPEDVGWAFWKRFRNPVERLENWAADLVFRGPNDLIVDTDSMHDLSDAVQLPNTAERIWDFNTSKDVHHMNYFRQPKTIKFFEDTLFKR